MRVFQQPQAKQDVRFDITGITVADCDRLDRALEYYGRIMGVSDPEYISLQRQLHNIVKAYEKA